MSEKIEPLVGICICDDSGMLIDINQNALKLMRLSIGEAIGRTIDTLLTSSCKESFDLTWSEPPGVKGFLNSALISGASAHWLEIPSKNHETRRVSCIAIPFESNEVGDSFLLLLDDMENQILHLK